MEERTLEQPNDAVLADAAYRYERSDGTVEYASNMEDVIARCPVIGRIALESPERANSLMALAAFGAEPTATITKKEAKNGAQAIVDQPNQEVPSPKKTQEQAVPDALLEPPVATKSAGVNTERQVMERVLPIAVREEHLADVHIDLVSKTEVKTLAEEYPADQMAEAILEVTPTDEVVTMPKQTVEPADKTIDVITFPKSDVERVKQPKVTSEISNPAESLDAVEIEELHSLLLDIYKKEEHHSKVRDTHESGEARTQDATPLNIITESPVLLEALRVNRTSDQPVVSFEAIQEEANEQPLMETLALVAEYVTSAEPETVPEAMRAFFDEIEQTLEGRSRHDPEQEMSSIVTAEMTEKLVQLLVLIGYERPIDTLLDCINTYSLELLLDTVEYICYLSKDGYNQEFKGNQTINFMPQGRVGQLQFSKLMYAFIAKITLQAHYTKL